MSDGADDTPSARRRPAASRAEREARTAAALRENLRRRKAQERARDGEEPSRPPAPDDTAEGG
ncbi:MAG: hypothetical protein EXQ97_03765 [Alphaproteobacteria bacterium]|nr:hypothetical protein [Alphaproteobacteria bacterium]